jgi:hypothetical protein
MPDKGLTPREAEGPLGYKRSTIYFKIHKGTIKVQKYGAGPNSVLIFEKDNKELFARRRAFMNGEELGAAP